jgi:SAM-dependent methyltransferase
MTSQASDLTDLDSRFPEHPLWHRYERAFRWTPEGLDSLLDAGCAWGYGTRFFRAKARNVTGLDPSGEGVAIARTRYPDITFVEGSIDDTSFEPESFDAILCLDVLEHVPNEHGSLDEIARLLKPGGRLILTVPHRGALGFLDPYNYGSDMIAWAKRRMPWLWRLYRRAAGRPASLAEASNGNAPSHGDEVHRHYTVEDIRALLERTEFQGRYELGRIARTGFLLEALVINVHFFLHRILPGALRSAMEKALGPVMALDYRIPYNRLANNLAVEIVKR